MFRSYTTVRLYTAVRAGGLCTTAILSPLTTWREGRVLTVREATRVSYARARVGTAHARCAPARAFSQQGSQTDPAGGEPSRFSPASPATTSSPSEIRRRRQHDRTGSGAVGYPLHALHFLTLFRNGKGLSVSLLRTAAHQFRALVRPAFVWIAVPAALAATKHLDRAIFTAAPEGSELASTPRVVRRPSRIAGERSTRSNGNQN